MRYIVGIICLITSLLLCACSEDDEKGAERYSGVFLSMEAIDAITPEDSFSDVILHNVEFEKVEVGKGEPIEAGDYTVKTETTYDLIMQESEADLYIKTEKRTDKMFEATYVYKYVFKQGTYGVIEVSGLYALMMSKYLQSRIENTYKEAEKFLKCGRKPQPPVWNRLSLYLFPDCHNIERHIQSASSNYIQYTSYFLNT